MTLDGCNFYFNRLTLKWEYSETACGQMLSTYIDVIICYMMIISVLTIDITTYILMKRFNSVFFKWKVGTALALFIPS